MASMSELEICSALMIRNSGEGSLGREGKSAQSGESVVIDTHSCAIHLPR